jgi:serine/threonine protein kinase
MNPTREEALFALALEKPSEKRAAFLDAICDGDPALRARLEALLAAHEQPATLLDTAADAPRAEPGLRFTDEPADDAVGQTIGRYKLLEKIGEGGCGVVYVAEQTEPVRRRVALKVIKLGMDTKQVVARFEAERQALAMMDHPNIAKVLDAGTTEAPVRSAGFQPAVSPISNRQGVASSSAYIAHNAPQAGSPAIQQTGSLRYEGAIGAGRPYFVMELVRGIKITDYCDQANLSTKERLDLFIKVCQAIQHAHQKGIIHRDIKPSNILVTLHDGVPVPKVIDFGIAKATEGRLTDATVYTQLHQFIGTPAYMSPEQAEMSGLDIDTRSDIYSLGVLLYELLTGSTPFDAKELMAQGLDAMRKTIREKEPVRPSTKLATLPGEDLTTTAQRRGADPPKLIHLLKGDLDWIVMKCLEKDRQRRYETANGLAADLKRHLNNEPVTARPPSTAYRFQKLLRRNKVMSAAAALVITAILLGTAISLAQTLRAKRELRRALAAEASALAAEAKALTEKANAQAALYFIQDDVLSQASPDAQPDRDLTVRALLDRIASRLDQATNRPPLVEASIRQTLGSVYTELGDTAKAMQHYQGALRLQREHLGERHPDTLRSLYGLAMAHWWSGDMPGAGPLTRQGLEESRLVLGEKAPLTLQFMQARAFTLAYSGEMRWTETEPLFLRALTLHREVLGPDHPATLRLMWGFGIGYLMHWQGAKAEPLVADALERSRRVLGEEHPNTSGLMGVLAATYLQLNQPEKAELLALRAIELRRRTLGEEHHRTVNGLLHLARSYVLQQQFAKADPLVERTIELCRRLPFEKSPFVTDSLSWLGWDYLEQGHVTKAETLCDLALQGMRRKPDSIPMVNSPIISRLGAIRLAQEKYAEAEALLREGSQLAENYSPDPVHQFHIMSLLGASLAGQKKYADAEPLLLQGYQELQQRQTGASSPHFNLPRRITESLERLVQLYDAWGKPAQAAEWKQKLAEFQQAAQAAEKKGAQP